MAGIRYGDDTVFTGAWAPEDEQQTYEPRLDLDLSQYRQAPVDDLSNAFGQKESRYSKVLDDGIVDPDTYLDVLSEVTSHGPRMNATFQAPQAATGLEIDTVNLWTQTLPSVGHKMATQADFYAHQVGAQRPGEHPPARRSHSETQAWSSMTSIPGVPGYHPPALVSYTSAPAMSSFPNSPLPPVPKLGIVRKATETCYSTNTRPDRQEKKSRGQPFCHSAPGSPVIYPFIDPGLSADTNFQLGNTHPAAGVEAWSEALRPVGHRGRRALSINTQVHNSIHLEVPKVSRQPSLATTSPTSDSSVRSFRSSRRTAIEMRSSPAFYRCQECHAGFEEKQDLRHHKRKHTTPENKPHGCDQCPQRFLHPKDLRRHLRVHQPASFFCPFEGCRYAERGFKREDHLKRHLEKTKGHQRMDPDSV
ncbi:zinc finger protein [Teratosphaeria destructans]|uniref:Zinc finger protein n=1 Tax=Teratosphaeria destructans TaxID=418781 RepID=A0A9W7SLB1_9PEZI|nr:zinc finger protein [Teratosphaeria destructans]